MVNTATILVVPVDHCKIYATITAGCHSGKQNFQVNNER